MGSISRLSSGVSRTVAANLLGAPTSICGLFFAFVLTSAVSWTLLLFSWWLIELRSRLVRGYSLTFLWWVEMASAAVAALAHFVLLYFAVHWVLPLAAALRYVHRRYCRRGGSPGGFRGNGHMDGKDVRDDESYTTSSVGDTSSWGTRSVTSSITVSVGSREGLQQRTHSPLPTSLDAKAGNNAALAALVNDTAAHAASLAARKPHDRLVKSFPYAVAGVTGIVFLIHVIIHRAIPDHHRQSQEIVLGLVRVIADVVIMTACEIFIALRLEKIAVRLGRSSGSSGGRREPVSYVRIVLYLGGAAFTIGTLYTLTRFLYLVFTIDTVAHLKLGVVGSFDICKMEGMQTDPALAQAWVWPALTHRRLFNFWTGSENCSHASGWPSISHLDRADHVLLVSPVCFDGTQPQVFLHRPENSEFTGSTDVKLPETERGNLEYHRQLEALYGTAALAASQHVVARRDPTTRRILSVAFDPATLTAQARVPRTPEEAAARLRWPQGGKAVFSVPLGLSAAYTVFCEAADHEEYHLYPLDDALLDAYSAGINGTRLTGCVPAWRRAGSTAPRSAALTAGQHTPSSPPLSTSVGAPSGKPAALLLDGAATAQPLLVSAESAMTLGADPATSGIPFFTEVNATQPMVRRATQEAAEDVAASPPPTPASEPAGNVFIMLFDAVSRQEMQRSLPKLSRALADFAADNATQHLVVEAEGAMTLGVNTAANLVPYFAGITANAVGLRGEVRFTDVSFIDRTVFVKAKDKYGDAVSTAFTSAFCHDLLEYLMGYTVPSSGAGGRATGIDRYMYSPFCHLDYSGVHSNLRGPYSIVRRCMAGQAVWDHMVNYTTALLEHQMEGTRRAGKAPTRHPIRAGDCDATMPDGNYGKHFFHVMYMTEGHEGTHGVIPLVDESLTRFFLDLRFKLRFFDNPLNTFLLLADHGNHMGHYHGYSEAGKFERGTPPTVLAIHPEVLNRIDANKKRKGNTARLHLTHRSRRISTPLDIYLTLADIMNVEADVYEKYKAEGIIHPASLFDLRDLASRKPARNCSQFSSAVEHYPCPLDYCQLV